MIQAKGEEIVVLVPLFLRIRLAAAPQQQAAAAARAESHIDIYPIANYPANNDKGVLMGERAKKGISMNATTRKCEERSIYGEIIQLCNINFNYQQLFYIIYYI